MFLFYYICRKNNMAVVDYTILFQKEKTGSSLKDLVNDFDMVCLSFPLQLNLEAKDVVSDDWPEEDGEDWFEPDVLPLKAYDINVEIGYSGDNWGTKIESFLNYLTGQDGSGVKIKMYDVHTGIGRKGVRFKSYEPNLSGYDGKLMTFTLRFRVTDPRAKVTPQYAGSEITGLK